MIQFLAPFSTQPPSTFSARVRIAAGSEPASGSESAKAPSHSPEAIFGRTRCFRSSEPSILIGSEARSWTAMISEVEASPLAISSTATQNISSPVPVPPYSSLNGSPSRSCSAKSSRRSCGNSPVASISAARGTTRSLTIWRITSRKSSCSWVRPYWGASVAIVISAGA